tara:strand:- start:23644 stop:24159 length:516 start_codon:yes stop_codon:yes gene_type:complete
MISSKLKHHFLQKKIDKLLAKSASLKVSSDKKINTVAILTRDGDSNIFQLQEMVIEKLKVRNPKIYSYRKFDKNDEKSYKHFSGKDFNWKGDIVDSSLLSFIDEPVDLLICFYPEKQMYLEYLTLLSKASFKIGFAEVNQDLFDLEISVGKEQIDFFLNEAYKYLTIMKKL